MTRSTQHPHYELFLAELRSERRARGVTQTQVAEAIGNRQTFVSKIENGDRRLDVIDLLEYLIAIGADPGDFIRRLTRKLRAIKTGKKMAVSRSRRTTAARKR